jgi:hypothetical protein
MFGKPCAWLGHQKMVLTTNILLHRKQTSKTNRPNQTYHAILPNDAPQIRFSPPFPARHCTSSPQMLDIFHPSCRGKKKGDNMIIYHLSEFISLTCFVPAIHGGSCHSKPFHVFRFQSDDQVAAECWALSSTRRQSAPGHGPWAHKNHRICGANLPSWSAKNLLYMFLRAPQLTLW